MKDNINILCKTECTGCSVCCNICPHDAIEMIETKEGFHYPLIYDDKCTNCGLCVKQCHALNCKNNNTFEQEIYKVKASDDIIMKSSSGGMFTLVSNYVLENNGYVCGASFTEDYLEVEHTIINDKNSLYKLRGSKYIESSLGNTFLEIKKLLVDGKFVLFSGCPCQVSALNSYLNKEYKNLITMDILCNSVVPAKIWKKYLKEIFTNDEIKNIEYASFRDKTKFGWGRGIYIRLKNGKEYLRNKDECLYNKLFKEHTSVKDECLYCKYRSFNRISDMTIGDYWGINDNNGVSLVLINNIKAKNIFYTIRDSYSYYERVFNPDIINSGLSGITPIFSNRKYFFDNLENESLRELYINSYNTKYNVAIINMAFQDNYGAALTYYALYKIIYDLGYNPILVYSNNMNYLGNTNSIYDNANGNKFSLKYMNIANEKFSKDNLREIVNKCDIFLVGSDQVWRYEYHKNNIFYYLFNFLYNDKKKIAYSSSFGISFYEGNNENKLFFKYYLKQFNNISVREYSGVDICKKEFDVNVEKVLDPVFLIDNYDYLVSKSRLNINYKYIAVYSRRGDKRLDEYLNYASSKLELPIIKTGKIDDSDQFYDKDFSIEDWLYMIKNCDFFISDSFHGICFSILFNKPFILVINDGAISKYESLIKTFNLENRVINHFSDIVNNDKLFTKMDFNFINDTLNTEKFKSIEWLKNALSNSSKDTLFDDYQNDMINYLINENSSLNNQIHNINKELDNIRQNMNWIKLFGIYNNDKCIYIYILGIRISIKVSNYVLNKIAWFIPIRKWRDNFRLKFRPDQTRPDQTRPDQTRPDQTRPDQT